MKLKDRIKEIIEDNCFGKMTSDQIDYLSKKIEEDMSNYVQLINETSKLEWVLIPDVLYIDRDGRYSSFVTFSGEYKQYLTYVMLVEITNKYDFEVSDNKILVNMSKVKKYDSERGRVYFDDEIVKESRFTYLSKRNSSKFRKRFVKGLDIAYK